MLSPPCFTFLKELKQQLSNDLDFLAPWQAISDDPAAYPDDTIIQYFIMKGGRICLPQGSPFIHTLLTEFHSSPRGRHMGIAKTLARIRENFNWSGIQQDAKHFVVAYVDCQHTKYETRKVVGLLCPLPIPFRPWEDHSGFYYGLAGISRPYHYPCGCGSFFERDSVGDASISSYFSHCCTPFYGHR